MIIPKIVDSLYQISGNNTVLRLLQTRHFCDKKWLPLGTDSPSGAFLVVHYSDLFDRYLQTIDRITHKYWDLATTSEIDLLDPEFKNNRNKNHPHHKDNNHPHHKDNNHPHHKDNNHPRRVTIAANLFRASPKNNSWFDNFNLAYSDYQSKALSICGVTVQNSDLKIKT